MKTITLAIALLSGILTSYGQLNGNARYIKKAFPNAYENTLKRYAIEEWGVDHSMVLWEINKQADALTEFTRIFKTENSTEAIRAIKEWTISGFETQTTMELERLEEMSRKALLRFNCDWKMVLYEYKKQVKAKNLY